MHFADKHLVQKSITGKGFECSWPTDCSGSSGEIRNRALAALLALPYQ